MAHNWADGSYVTAEGVLSALRLADAVLADFCDYPVYYGHLNGFRPCGMSRVAHTRNAIAHAFTTQHAVFTHLEEQNHPS